MRKIRKIITILILLFITLVIAGVAVTYIYKDEVIILLKKELNKNLETTINVESIDFSVLKKFPFAAVQFNNVTALSKKGFADKADFSVNADTLFTFETLFLEFNIIDLFNKKYRIKRLDARKGKMYLLINKAGKENYHIWKSKQDDNNDPEMALVLSGVQLSDVSFFYLNQFNNLHVKGFIPDLKLKGDFSKENFNLSIDAESDIENLIFSEVQYINEKRVALNTTVRVIKTDYHIKKGVINIAGIPLNLNGHLKTGSTKHIDMKVYSNNIDIHSFIKNLPAVYNKNIKKIKGQGNGYFAATISGIMHKNKVPGIYANFGIRDGKIAYSPLEKPVSNIHLTGSFSNGDKHLASSSSVVFKQVSATLGASNIKGKGAIMNLKAPRLNFSGTGNINFSDLKNITIADTLESLEGTAKYDLKMSCSLKEWNKFNAKNITNSKLTGDITIKNGGFKIKGVNIKASQINGVLSINNNISFNDFSLVTGKTRYMLSGKMMPSPPLFSEEKQDYHISAGVIADKIDMKHYAPRDDSSDKSAKAILFPENITVDLDFALDDFVFDHFIASNVKGNLNYKPKMFTLKSVSFNTMGGNIVGGGVIIQKHNNDFAVRSQSKLNNIDAGKLFYAFNNFNQETLKDEHLKGKITSTLDFQSEFDENFNIQKPTVNAYGKIKINDGELVNFEPMLGLSKFINVEELKHIRFSTLENTIRIIDEKIIIPRMDIHSSAFNINGSGIHQFDNHFTYHVNVLFSELLSKKVKAAKAENEKFGVVEDKKDVRTRLFLKIEGNMDNYNVSYDRQKVKDKRKDRFEEEKNELKTILHQEFGLFKKDTALKKEQEEPDFDIKWEEEEDNNKEQKERKDKTKTETKKDTDKEEPFMIKWDED